MVRWVAEGDRTAGIYSGGGKPSICLNGPADVGARAAGSKLTHLGRCSRSRPQPHMEGGAGPSLPALWAAASLWALLSLRGWSLQVDGALVPQVGAVGGLLGWECKQSHRLGLLGRLPGSVPWTCLPSCGGWGASRFPGKQPLFLERVQRSPLVLIWKAFNEPR